MDMNMDMDMDMNKDADAEVVDTETGVGSPPEGRIGNEQLREADGFGRESWVTRTSLNHSGVLRKLRRAASGDDPAPPASPSPPVDVEPSFCVRLGFRAK